VSMSQPHPLPALRTGSEAFLRVLFGLFLAVIAIALVFYSPNWYAAVTVLVALFGAREWHRMVRSSAQREVADLKPIHIQTAVTAGTIACAVAALVLRQVPLAFLLLAVGAVAAFFLSRQRDDNPLWHAGGVIYIGLPSLALVALRVYPPQGALVVLGLFLIVWATDTGALVFGKLIGGKKIAPRLSPGKTWAGTIGGSVTAALIFAAFIWFLGGSVWQAGLFGFLFSVTAHAGDLFESFVKRRFGIKDSGAMIPGHGGVLDRMDSTLAASVAMALLVFLVGLNPLFGVVA